MDFRIYFISIHYVWMFYRVSPQFDMLWPRIGNAIVYTSIWCWGQVLIEGEVIHIQKCHLWNGVHETKVTNFNLKLQKQNFDMCLTLESLVSKLASFMEWNHPVSIPIHDNGVVRPLTFKSAFICGHPNNRKTDM